MKNSGILTFLAILIAVNGICLGFGDAVYSGTYVDAAEDNTVAYDGTDPWYLTGENPMWQLRGFANNATIFENDAGTGGFGDAPLLVTTATGLNPYQPYEVYVVYWNGGTADWRVWGGAKPDEIVSCSKANGTATGGVEGNRLEYEKMVGVGFADGAGNLSVYVDDHATSSSTYRTWYDGIVYAQTFMAYHPTPADGEDGVALDTVVTWDAMLDSDNPSQVDPDLVEHKVYLNDDPNLLEGQAFTVAAGQTLEADPVLEANKTYYWRVDEVTSTETVTGAVWTFDTIKTVPDFDPPLGSQPEDTAVFPGENATLIAVAGTTGGLGGSMNYQWYKGLPGDYSSPVSGATSSELTLAAQVADDGNYFCNAANDVGDTDSEGAAIQVNRLMAHYKYNQSIADETGNTTPAALVDPNYIGGIDGDAAIFTGTEYIDLGLDGYPNSVTPSGCLYSGTVSYWVKTEGTGTVMGTYTDGYNTAIRFDIGYSMVRSQDDIKLQANYSSSLVTDGQWHLVTTTYDSGTAPNAMTVYIDGEEVSTVTQSSEMVHIEWQYPVFIGGFNNRGTGPADNYTGDLDDMRIYNYPLDSFEVAQLYIDFVPDADPICANRPEFDFTGPEGVPDCKVNLYDFAEIAKEWLVCGVIPASDCQ
ncbi:MAG: hypothetical protein KAS23_08355 [Anaerohalosphaera sp.]|nr:hypothetical protein [Anaerohalosphaera sp.]